MKKYLSNILIVLWTVAVWTSCADAQGWVQVANFDNAWQVGSSGSGSGTVATQGGAINVTARGDVFGGFLGTLFKTETAGIAGMWATLRVDQVSGNCELGLKATIGQIENKRIQIVIYLTEYNLEKSIQYNISMVDTVTNTSVFFNSGTFGGPDGAWVSGKPQIVAFARFGSEIWVYADGYKQMHKIQLMDGIMPAYEYVAAFVSAPTGPTASITGSISDVYLYYE